MGTLKQNQIPSDPSLADLLDIHSKGIKLSLNCHHIGAVQEFNAAKQTARVTVNYKKTFFDLDQASGSYIPVLIDYPILVDCPVIVLGGGGGSLTFPIKSGDECLVIFNDRDIDNWFNGGSGAAVATGRLHSFSDAIILVGLRSLSNVLADYEETRVVLQNGSTLVGLGPSLIKIANDVTTLNTLLQDLVTAIKSLTTTNSIPGAPCAISAASQAALTSLGLQIGGLLE